MKIEIYERIKNKLKYLIKDTEFENHTYLVGGCVRDKIMGNEIKDIDIVLDIQDGGIRFAEWMKDNGHNIGSVITYPTYGTAMFRLKDFPDVELECVQTRKEQYKDKTSRNPETCYGTIYEDAMRRDLTINALFYNISHDEVLDITGKGIEDIKNHIIRVTSTPEIVFTDDPLRMLRCVRFSTRFGWNIEDSTYQGMIKNADRLSIITKERIQDELNKMLLCDRPVMAMEMLKEIGLMKYVIPELCETFELKQNKYHGFNTVWEHTLKVLANIIDSLYPTIGVFDTLTLRMSALLHDIGKIKTQTTDENGNIHFYKHELKSYDLCETILKRLKYSNDFIKDVQFLVQNHMRTKQWGDDCCHMKDKTLRKLQYECGYKYYSRLFSLIDADNKAHADGYCLPNQCKKIDDKTRYMIENHTDMFNYTLPVNGVDIMCFKSLKPSKEVKLYLDYLLKLAFNNPKISREECFKMIKNIKF